MGIKGCQKGSSVGVGSHFSKHQNVRVHASWKRCTLRPAARVFRLSLKATWIFFFPPSALDAKSPELNASGDASGASPERTNTDAAVMKHLRRVCWWKSACFCLPRLVSDRYRSGCVRAAEAARSKQKPGGRGGPERCVSYKSTTLGLSLQPCLSLSSPPLDQPVPLPTAVTGSFGQFSRRMQCMQKIKALSRFKDEQ